MANIRGLLKSFFGVPEVVAETRREREMPFERVISSPDGTKRFLFRASEEGRVLTIALQAVNSAGGWGNIFEANEMLDGEHIARHMVRLDAATRECLTSDHLQIYDESGERHDGRMWSLGSVGEAEREIAAGYFPEESLPETILINATVAGFLDQVRVGDFSTPRFVGPASGETTLTVPLFRDLLT